MTIAVRDLTRTFDEKAAVDGVSFDVAESEFFVLVGPSGCGKTTTLRLLAGLEEASGGEVAIDDRVVTDIRPRDRDVAMVFQDYAVFPHLTVFENIAYGLRSRRVRSSVVRERVPHAADMFRITHLLRRKPRQLSGGERQRVALARALVRDARAYLYDEPLSNLDAQLRHQAREDILALHRRQQRPTVYVTHDQSEAMAMGDRIAVMRDGSLQQVGTGRELYEHPTNLFVAFFVGTPSINLFDVELRADPDPGSTDVLAVGTALRLRLTGRVSAVARHHLGRPVKLGIRPESLQSPRQATFAVTEDNTLHTRVEIIEPTTTGSTVYLTTLTDELTDDSQDVAASFPMRLPERYVGQEVPLAVEVDNVHLFDAETEHALTTAEEA